MEYTYEVVRVNTENDVMEVKYTSLEHGEALVGMPLPRDGEAVEDLIKAYSPVPRWDYKMQAVVPPSVGLRGTIEQETPRERLARSTPPVVAEDPIFDVGGVGEPVKVG